jgi:hypothetical protein
MQMISAGQHKTVRERACVMYDKTSGAIRHIQHVIVMEGGHDPDEREIEEMCRMAFTKRGDSHDGLETLHLDRGELQPSKMYRVDPKRKVLVGLSAPKRTAAKKSGRKSRS